MNWENLEADVTRILPGGCYTPGRNGSIQGVTIHHMAGDLSVDQCYRIWSGGAASAHYAVQADGTIGQLVNDADTAWACAHAWANANTISIEHANDSADPWTVGPVALDAGAHLTAAVCRYYGLGRPEWLKNVYPHKHWSATACPGELYGSQKDEYIERAQAWYDAMGGGSEPGRYQPAAPAPAPAGGTTGEGFGGTYVCQVDTLNVRDAPGLGGSVVASYGRGEAVNLDDWYQIADGYVWGRYVGYSGATRYIAVGPATGEPSPDDFLVKDSASGSSAPTTSSDVPAGTYACQVDTLNVRAEPGLSGEVVASYGYGETVVLDGWSEVADGYVWGRYVGYSGATRYVAVRSADGSEVLLA